MPLLVSHPYNGNSCLSLDLITDRLISKRVLEFPMTFFYKFSQELKKTKEMG